MPKSETPLPRPLKLQRQQAIACGPYDEESSSESSWEPSSPSCDDDADLLLLDIQKDAEGKVVPKVPHCPDKGHKETVGGYLDELIEEAREQVPPQPSTLKAHYAIDGRYVFEYSGEFTKEELEGFKTQLGV